MAAPARRAKPASTAPPAAAVGERVRTLRRGHAWTLEELAAASQVSRSMLSQIERGEANPTLAVAFRIARALGRTLDELVGAPPTSGRIDTVRHDDPAALFRSDRQTRVRTLSPQHLEKDVEFYEITLAPGATMGGPAHFAGTREVVTVRQSRVRLTAGADTQELEPGDSASYPADVQHTIENIGTEEALLFLVDIYRVSAPRRAPSAVRRAKRPSRSR